MHYTGFFLQLRNPRLNFYSEHNQSSKSSTLIFGYTKGLVDINKRLLKLSNMCFKNVVEVFFYNLKQPEPMSAFLAYNILKIIGSEACIISHLSLVMHENTPASEWARCFPVGGWEALKRSWDDWTK